MIKNKLNSAFLSMLLLVPSQAFCSQQPPVPQGILNRLYLSMPAAPAWMTNLTTNMTSGFSSLSDKTKYLIYGAMATLLSYVGYKAFFSPSSSSILTPVPTEIDGRVLRTANLGQLNDQANLSNVAYIIKEYTAEYKAPIREKAFQYYVCPVLKEHQEELSLKENWEKFLTNVSSGRYLGIVFLLSPDQVGYRMFSLINKTCPNEKFTEPLKELLIERNPHDTELLRVLNQQ